MNYTIKPIFGATLALAINASPAFAGDRVTREQVDATSGSATSAVISHHDGGMIRTPVDSLQTCFDLGHDLLSRVSCMDENDSVITSFNCYYWSGEYCEQIRPEDFDLSH